MPPSPSPLPAPQNFEAGERRFLLDIARQTLTRAASNAASPGPAVNTRDLPPKLSENKGCFVTLTENGGLRGCVGYILPQEALYQAVVTTRATPPPAIGGCPAGAA